MLPKISWRRAAATLAAAIMLTGSPTWASDHDDGETSAKGRNRNLTDLYVFREDDQTGNPADAGNMVFIMNSNPRSLARQQYFFSATARYEFHVTRVPDRNTRPTGADDMIFRFSFGSPDQAGQQTITLTRITLANGFPVNQITIPAGRTSPAAPGLGNAPATVINTPVLDGLPITIFAGLREDPFFFDVEQFFRVRAGLLGRGPAVGFRSPDTAVDFAKGYNVNAIVMRVPLALLQQGNPAITTFDVWESISALQ